MNVLSEVKELGGTVEADGRGDLSEDVKAGGVTDPVDVLLDGLLVVGDVGDNGEVDWMGARLDTTF